MKNLTRNISLIAGSSITAFFVSMAAIAHFWTPFDPAVLSIADKLQAPSAHHWFGTDQYGRDTLSRVIYGTRTALLAIVMADGLALMLGGSLGLVAGYVGAGVDALIMRTVDVLLAFPYLLLALIIVVQAFASGLRGRTQ